MQGALSRLEGGRRGPVRFPVHARQPIRLLRVVDTQILLFLSLRASSSVAPLPLATPFDAYGCA